MHELALWAGFVGAWLLVAGPVYQAVLELQEEAAESEHVSRLRDRMHERPPRPSAWWWLFPPAYLFLSRRISEEYKRVFMESLSADEYRALSAYLNKATGWLFVAGGAFLIAVKETYELVEGHEWEPWLTWLLIALGGFLAVGNAVARQLHDNRELERHGPTAAPG